MCLFRDGRQRPTFTSSGFGGMNDSPKKYMLMAPLSSPPLPFFAFWHANTMLLRFLLYVQRVTYYYFCPLFRLEMLSIRFRRESTRNASLQTVDSTVVVYYIILFPPVCVCTCFFFSVLRTRTTVHARGRTNGLLVHYNTTHDYYCLWCVDRSKLRSNIYIPIIA